LRHVNTIVNGVLLDLVHGNQLNAFEADTKMCS